MASSTTPSCTDKISSYYNQLVTFCDEKKQNIKGFAANQIQTAGKTHNFALVIFAAAITGLALHMAASFIPPYIFVGVFIGIAINVAKNDIAAQISEKWNAGKWMELALSTISLGLSGWYFPMSALCTTVTVLVADPSVIPRTLKSLQPAPKPSEPPVPPPTAD